MYCLEQVVSYLPVTFSLCTRCIRSSTLVLPSLHCRTEDRSQTSLSTVLPAGVHESQLHALVSDPTLGGYLSI
jgi:hypothetical protein